jgi:hypothetical protein
MKRIFAVIAGIISVTTTTIYLILGFMTSFTTGGIFGNEGALTTFVYGLFVAGGFLGGLAFILPRLVMSKKEKVNFKPSEMPIIIRKAYRKGAIFCIVGGIPSIFLVAEEVTPGALVVVAIGIFGLILGSLPARSVMD